MCGIVGLLQTTSDSTCNSEKFIQTTLVNQQHRGPDATMHVTLPLQTGQLQLGHNRLSIIDLSREANQPLHDATKQHSLIFNGMIYNYVELRQKLENLNFAFHTESDTEVLLNALIAWGEQALNELNGMFAFAYYNANRQTLLLARDRFGVKPLYYFHNANCLAFASTSQPLAAQFQLQPNLAYLAQGLKYSVYESNTEMTAYEKLYSLAPGHLMKVTIENQAVKIKKAQWYNLANQLSVITHDDYEAEFSELFHSSINLRLRSDVPLAVSLSGGLDSSSIMQLAAEQQQILGISFGDPHDDYSEGAIIQRAARHSHWQVHYLQPTAQQFQDQFWKTLQMQDAPFPSLSIVAQNFVFKEAHSLGIKVMLGGQGGDELLLGYRKFLIFYYQLLLQQKNYATFLKKLPDLFLTAYSEIPRTFELWRNRHRYRAQGKTQDLLLPDITPLTLGLANNEDLVSRQIRDITQISLPTLLRYEDRNSMASSIESRLPFLDYRLVEFAINLPISAKIRRGYGKWILRHMMKNKLPREICFARNKRGFDVQQSYWLSNGLGQSMREQLLQKQNSITEFMPKNSDLNSRYSDQSLINTQGRLAEAITLLWLSMRIS